MHFFNSSKINNTITNLLLVKLPSTNNIKYSEINVFLLDLLQLIKFNIKKSLKLLFISKMEYKRKLHFNLKYTVSHFLIYMTLICMIPFSSKKIKGRREDIIKYLFNFFIKGEEIP